MANLNSQLRMFEEWISLTPTQTALIIKRHLTLRTVITEYFKGKKEMPTPDFFIQGS